MCKACDYTIHGAQHHFGWDNSFAPVERVEPGQTIKFHCHDSSAGQLGPSSTVADVAGLDFGKINPVSGPIWVEGAEPGDALKITLDSFAPQTQGGKGWGWTANIPGFGLLADQFTDPALHIWSYEARYADTCNVWQRGARAFEALRGHNRQCFGGKRPAFDRATPARWRQSGHPRSCRRHDALSAC